jgi:citronellol/citronellal dehydrogenase
MYQSIFKPDLFKQSVVVITGGGSGIGRCTAHELASLGAQVAIIGRNVDKLVATQNEIQARGGLCSIHQADIRIEEQVEACFEAIEKQHGKMDGLVNNAGGQYPAPLEAISLKGWEAVVKTNLTGGFICSKAALHFSMKAKGGSIVNIIADMWGGMPGMGHSGAARAGMLNFTETAATEWAQYGVRVNAIAPGWIASSGFDTYDSAMQAELRRLQKVVPLQRFGTESEVAAAIVFLLSPAANFMTGSCLRLDGGVPNARHTWPTQTAQDSSSTEAFNGFDLASLPKMLSSL